MTYSPYLGRFLEEDPIGFEGGDDNLYRFVGNNPMDRTDPSGEYYVTTNPDPIVKRLKDAGVNNPTVHKLPSGLYYVRTTTRDAEALFKVANDLWGKEVFDKKLYDKDRKAWEKAAKKRNDFLFAGGAAGGYLEGGTFFDPNSCETIKISQEDRQGILAVNEKLRDRNKKSPPLIVDVGGEGRNTKKDDAQVVNLNRVPFQQKEGFPPIPNFIYGDGRSLPFRDGSVDYIYYENMDVNDKFVKELLRVLMPGGAIRVYSTLDGLKVLRKMFADINSKLEFADPGNYLGQEGASGIDVKLPKAE